LSTAAPPELAQLTGLSARLGANPLLVQAATGNTSLKIGGKLWIKASGHWLSRACTTEMFLSADREQILRQVALGSEPESQQTAASGNVLRSSVETAMHAILPWPAVLHVHSVKTIAWAVRSDAPARLAERLSGLAWSWIPYVISGIPLAREISRAIAVDPATSVFVLGNHGLVVCGRNCREAEALLDEVEARLSVETRTAPPADFALLDRLLSPGWHLPSNPVVHQLATDPAARQILAGGILYPCQAIFLSTPPGESGAWKLIEGVGVLLRHSSTPVIQETLAGLAAVVARIDPLAPLRYLDEREVAELLSRDVYQYRDLVEANDARLTALL
jgi:rhamnose utilization protein RhaD (predicted bifunctional aldolase and dehydrogenase)